MTAVLTQKEIWECLTRPLDNRLFISPLLEQDQVGDTSIDLRIGQHLLVPKSSKLGVIDVVGLAHEKHSETHIANCYGRVRLSIGGYFMMHPGDQVHVSSLEYIGMPNDLVGDVTLRHKFSSFPIMASTAKIHPGFRGSLTMTLMNNAPFSIKLYPGLRFAQMELRWLSYPVESPHRSGYVGMTAPHHLQLHRDKDIRKLGPTVEPYIIGIVSTIAAGRTTVTKYLEERYGFKLFRLSDMLKEEALRRGIQTLKPQLQSLGNLLRESYGDGYLAHHLRHTQDWLNNKYPFVLVDGFKHPEEVLEFKKQERFKLIGIDAPEQERMRRAIARRRSGDPTNELGFVEADRMDRGIRPSVSEHSQQVDRVLQMVEPDNLTYNNGSIEDLHKRIDKLVKGIREYTLW